MSAMMNVDTVAMAEDLELKMNNLINGYEQLDMISSKLPSSMLHMAAKHTKNLLGDAEILTPQDHEDFKRQQEVLGKVRQDLQGMAYERVVIDVLTRDAILNAKRKPRHLRAKAASSSRLPTTKHFTGSTPPLTSTLPSAEPSDLDSPIPIRAYPSTASPHPPSPPSGARHAKGERGDRSGNHDKVSSGTTAEMHIGSLPAAIRGLHTTPDNTPRYRKGKKKPRVNPGNEKYRHLNTPTSIPRVDKGTVDPETLLTYALARKKDDASDAALKKLVAIQDKQAQELGQLRGLLHKIAEQDDRQSNQAHQQPLHPYVSSPHHQQSLHDSYDSDSDDGEVDPHLNQYKIITVSPQGFQSGQAPPSPPHATPARDDRAPAQGISDSQQDSDPEKEKETEKKAVDEVEYELVINAHGESAWVAKTVHRLPVSHPIHTSANTHVPTHYADPFGGRVTNGLAGTQTLEDGHTHVQYVDMFSGEDSSDARGLIVVTGEGLSSTAGGVGANLCLPYMPKHLNTHVPVPTPPTLPQEQEQQQMVTIAANTITSGISFPKGYTYASKVTSMRKEEPKEESLEEKEEEEEEEKEEEEEEEEEEKGGEEKVEEEEKDLPPVLEDAVKEPLPLVNEPKEEEELHASKVGPISADKDLLALLHQLVHTQQSTMQGHNELILALLNQQQRGPPLQDEKTTTIKEPSTDTDAPGPEKESEILYEQELEQEQEQDESKSTAPTPSSTSFGNLLKKGATAYAQSPADMENGGGQKKPRVMSAAVMQTDVLPFYGATATTGPTETRTNASTTANDDANTSTPTQVIAGVLVDVLKQLTGGHGQNIHRVLPTQHQTTNRDREGETYMTQDNKYHGDSGRNKAYRHVVPSEQRGQQYAPLSAWARPLPSAWVNVSVPPSQSDRARMRRSLASAATESSGGSWDEDFHLSSSLSTDRDGDEYNISHKESNASGGLLLHDSRDHVFEREDPTLAMLRRDMADSHQHRSALSHHYPHQQQQCTGQNEGEGAGGYAEDSVDESWDVIGTYSSDSSLGSYQSLSINKNTTTKGNNPRKQHAIGWKARHNSAEVPGEAWFDGDGRECFEDKKAYQGDESTRERRQSQRQPAGTSKNYILGGSVGDSFSSLDLPTPLFSSVVPCAETLHYANRKPCERKLNQGHGQDHGSYSRHRYRKEKDTNTCPSRDPTHENPLLHLAVRHQQFPEQHDEILSQSTYSSGDSYDHTPSFRQPRSRPSYQPTRSDYEPSTPSTSTTSSTLGSISYPRPSCMLRNKFEKETGGDDSKPPFDGSGDEKGVEGGRGAISQGVHNHFMGVNSIDSEDSATERYARFIADDSSLDDSSLEGQRGEKGKDTGRGGNKGVKGRQSESSMSDSSSSGCVGRSVGSRSVESDSSLSYDAYSSVSDMSSTTSSGQNDLTLPRSQLKLWRPKNTANKK